MTDLDPDIFARSGDDSRYRILFRGHCFTPYGEEEALCRACGFVAWPDPSEEALLDLLTESREDLTYCGGEHHLGLTKEQFATRRKVMCAPSAKRRRR